MKQLVILLCWIFPATLFAQQQFESPFKSFDNWEQVLDEAKAKNKNIFVDTYTSWCPNCKQMDREVYSAPSVANYIDSNFIAIKVQMDQTKNDPPKVTSWYSDAKMLLKKYDIQAFPTYIFLDKNGGLVQISKGYQTISTFLMTLKDANDPQKAIGVQIASYRAGKIANQDLLELALKTKEYKMDTIALEIAGTYKGRYLDKQKVQEVLKPELIGFLAQFEPIVSINDRIIQYIYEHAKLADSLMEREGISQAIIDVYADRQIFQPMLAPYYKSANSGDPNWEKVHKQLVKTYDLKTADRLVLNQRIGYYRKVKDYEQQAKFEIQKIEKFGLDTVGVGKTAINNLIYDLFFKHVENPIYLKKAIGYMKIILQTEPERDPWIDTYANILYKIGDKENAIINQERALSIAVEKKFNSRIKEYAENLQKMRSDQPTWTQALNN